MEVCTMNIESVSSVAGSSNYQSQASQQTKPVSQAQPVKEAVTDTTQSSAVNQAVVIGQVAESGQNKGTDGNASKDGKKEEAATSMKEVKDIRKLINNNTVAEFGYNEPTKRITIKIKDKDTDEVIKEIPSEKALEMLAKAWELAGIMIDEKR